MFGIRSMRTKNSRGLILIAIAAAVMLLTLVPAFGSDAAGPKEYTITASASDGATISPVGTVTVGGGASITFTFSAASVIVDEIPLSSADVAKKEFTFPRVNANHTIVVKGVAPIRYVNLVIDLSEGSGRADYSINGGQFTRYTAPVPLVEGGSINVKAIADRGYEFKSWWDGMTYFNVADVSFPNNPKDLTLDLRFTGEDPSGLPITLMVIVIAAIGVGLAGVIVYVYVVKKP
jgi:hypothetical protein